MGAIFDASNSCLGLQGDGRLLLSTAMRGEMQNILDELQKDMTNELDKVSLERLADINPDLLFKIKTMAEENVRNQSTSSTGASKGKSVEGLPVFFTETRSPQTLERSKVWKELQWEPLTKTHDVVSKLQHLIIAATSSSSEARYTQQEAFEMTQYYSAASATCSVLTTALEQLKTESSGRSSAATDPTMTGVTSTVGSGVFMIDRNDFTNDGIKEKNPAVIGLLYELGLPFVSSVDGRRFRTEIELSNHLDALFKKNQVEKGIAKTEERGWYQDGDVWSGAANKIADVSSTPDPGGDCVPEGTDATQEYDPETSTMPADEIRDRCAICGLNFKMYFDNDEGMYQYKNCREISVLNDDAAERDSEEVFVHVTCWNGLGSPQVLTMDQALQDTLPGR